MNEHDQTSAQMLEHYRGQRDAARWLGCRIYCLSLKHALPVARDHAERISKSMACGSFYQMGIVFELRAFLDRHSEQPVHALDVPHEV